MMVTVAMKVPVEPSAPSTGAVAEAVGCQSEAAFQRAFKSHMGVTPAQWRKQSSSAEAKPQS